jgi:O-antigen/teichoic acid export membrane protein
VGIARKSAFGFVGQIYMLGLGLVTTIIVARLLGPEGKGVLAIVGAIPSLALGVASFGLGPALAYLSGKDKYPARDLASAVVFWSLALGAALGAVVWVFSGALIASIFKGMTPQDLAVVLLSLPAYYVAGFMGALFIGHDRAVAYAVLQSVAATLNLVAVVTASVLLPRSSSAVVIAISIAAVLNAVISLAAYRSGLVLSPKRLMQVTKEAAPYAVKSYVGQATSMFFLRADVFFLNYFAGPAAVGVYSVATNLAEKLWLLSNPVSSAVYSKITGAERHDALRLTMLTSRALLILNGVAAVGLFGLAVLFVPLVYGAQFANAVLYLGLLLPGVVVYAVCQPYGHYFAGQLGRPAVTSKISAAMMVLSAVLYVALIPVMGASGASVGSTLAYSTALIGYGWLMPRTTSATLREMLVPTRDDFALYRSILGSGVGRLRRMIRNEEEQ